MNYRDLVIAAILALGFVVGTGGLSKLVMKLEATNKFFAKRGAEVLFAALYLYLVYLFYYALTLK